jgi:hypothetical protein
MDGSLAAPKFDKNWLPEGDQSFYRTSALDRGDEKRTVLADTSAGGY